MRRYGLRSSFHPTISIFYLLGLAGATILGAGYEFLEPFAALADGEQASFTPGWWLVALGIVGYLGYQVSRPAYLSLSTKGLEIHAPNAEFLPLAQISEVRLPAPGPLRVTHYAHRWGLSFGSTSFAQAPEGLVLVKAGPSWYGLLLTEPEEFLADLTELLEQQRSAS